MRRSIEFLKEGSKELTVDELLRAYSNGVSELFLSGDDEKGAKFEALVARTKGTSAAERELRQLMPDDDAKGKIRTLVVQLCWSAGGFSGFDAFVQADPKLVLQIVKSKLGNPAVRREVDKNIVALGGPGALDFDPDSMPL